MILAFLLLLLEKGKNALFRERTGRRSQERKWPFHVSFYSIIQGIKTLGARIKALRIRNSLKQAELASSAGIGTTVLARYEQGKILDINPWMLQKVAKSLKIDPAELFPGPEQAKNKDFLDYFCPSDTWGSRLRKLRLSQNLQQKELAEMIGISKVSVCRYEKDRVNPSKKIAEKIDKILKPV